MLAHRLHPALNELFATFGLLPWKPTVAALLLPPVPLLVMLLLAWWWQRRRPGLATTLLWSAVLGLWFSHCQVTGELLERALATAPTLSTQRLAELRRGAADNRTAIVVLAAGTRPLASEYGESHPSAASIERLQYALWLARQVPAPLMVAGGARWDQPDGPADATVLARFASRDLARPVRWVESESHDTRGMARIGLQLLQRDGIGRVILVTHGWHMRRALRAFAEEARQNGMPLQLVAAPMGLTADGLLPALQRWTPTVDGHQRVRQALREWIALAAGA